MKKLLLLFGFWIYITAGDIYATFDVKAYKEATITLNARGIVKNIYVTIGQKVKKGDILLKLDNLALVKSKNISQAELDALGVELKYAQKSLQRFKNLKDVIDNEAYDKITYKVDILKAKYATALAGIKYKQQLINDTYLKAPFDGVITDRYVQVGELVAGKCFTIMDRSKVKLILSFDEQYWKLIKKGLMFKYKIDGLDRARIDKITKVYPVANKKNRMIKAEVITKNLMPGLFGDGVIEVK